MRGDRPSLVIHHGDPIWFTPHARGSTLSRKFSPVSSSVYPACAGIDQVSSLFNCSKVSLPRMRGDRPVMKWGTGGLNSLPRMRGDRPRPRTGRSAVREFTPHARGSTPVTHLVARHDTVYPACAGIDLKESAAPATKPSLPRMRGDRPKSRTSNPVSRLFTPHARGSTVLRSTITFWAEVYPACAGIDPPPAWRWRYRYGLPRMRGDRPPPPPLRQYLHMFTPHARGSTTQYQ